MVAWTLVWWSHWVAPCRFSGSGQGDHPSPAGTTGVIVELDVALMAVVGESLRVRYRHRPRLHR
jgi:hypothetical protein